MPRVRVEVLPWLTDFLSTGGSGRAAWEEEVAGACTLRELVEQLARRNPEFGHLIFDQEAGTVRSHVNVILNDSLLELVGGLEAAVGDGDRVTLLPAYTGG